MIISSETAIARAKAQKLAEEISIRIRALRTAEEFDQFVRETPDEHLRLILKVASHLETNLAFDAIFVLIVDLKSNKTLQDIAVKESWLFPSLSYTKSAQVQKSSLKFISITLPAVIQTCAAMSFANLWVQMGDILKVLYAMPNKTEVFRAYRGFILEALRDHGRPYDPEKVLSEALKYGKNKEHIMRLMLGSGWDTLRDKVLGTSSVRVWDPLCLADNKVTEQDVTFLRDKARFHKVDNWKDLNVRQLCAELAKIDILTFDCSPDDADPWTM